MRPGRVNKPWPVPVQVARRVAAGIGRLAVESVREEWLVEDGWWTEAAEAPLLRAGPRGRQRRRSPSASRRRAAGSGSGTDARLHGTALPLGLLLPGWRPDPAELAATAADLGHEALALTDHDNVCGAMEFARACKGVGVGRSWARS